MFKCAGVLSVSLLICWIGPPAHSQGGPATEGQTPQLRVVVGVPDKSSNLTIVVPPETSWTGSIAFGAKKPSANEDPGNLAAWISRESAINGLQSVDLHPWHIVISYEQFDGDGDKVNSGVFEELWAGPKKYKLSYKSDELNQADYATEQGLFRAGDQRWPKRVEMQVRGEIVDPFSYASTLQGFQASSVERTFGAHSLDCVVLQRAPGAISTPTQYCFDHNRPALRYTRGFGWFQTTYNDIVSVQGRNIGREVEVTGGGKPYLKLHVNTVESIADVHETDFTPPVEAVNLKGKRLSGVILKPMQQPFPQWPTSLRQQHFSVTVEVVVGRDGHVVSAHAVSGPSEAYKSAEDTARRWTFQPYIVLDEPAEVETKIILSNN
jgi:hypothetical protein